MDIRNELDFQFLDLHDLNDSDKNQLIAILKSNAAIDALKLPWDIECNESQSTVAEIPELQNHWYHDPAMQVAQTYQPVMTTMCSDWQTPVYTVPTDVTPFIPGMVYGSPGYNIAEIHEIPYSRENIRRNNRGRGIRRDNFNRNLHEVQPGFVDQFHPMSVMYIQNMYPETPQQIPGQIYYSPMYSSLPNSYPHPGSVRYIRPQETKTPSKRPIKNFQNEEDNSSQTNIVTTVIVNNKVSQDTCVDETEKLPVNVKIEHNVSMNENCLEKNEIPRVNINSSIEVNNGERDKEQNESVSSVKTTVKTSTASPKVENETQNEEKKDTEEIAPTVSRSWASILKKGSAEAIKNDKPTARINPLPMNDKSTPEVANSQNKTADMAQKFDDPTVYRIAEFLVNYQMDKQTVSLLPRGLTNRSNYCYINSILQALLACPPFYNLLMALPCTKTTGKSSTPLIDNMIRFVREFTPLSDGARLARKDRAYKRGEDTIVDIQSGVAFEPSYVYTMLKNTSSAGVFSVEGRQEDAEEFLSCLLNGINDEMLELMKLINQNVEPVNYNSGEEEWKVMGPKNKGSITRCTEFGRTPLSDIFRGQLRSRVVRAGEQPTDNVQPFFTLQLDIEKAESVRSALEILVGKDQLEGMTCSKTKQQIEAWKQVTLEELPIILILHLKWFDYKLDGCSKFFKKVEFPVDLKIDAKFLSLNAIKKLNPKQKQYKLFAVTYHDGKEATKGHYVTDAFHVGYGGWVRYDDSSLKGVAESNVLNPSPPRVPYLLYYRRCDTIGNNQANKTR